MRKCCFSKELLGADVSVLVVEEVHDFAVSA
jgi:hypothetical protein